LTVGPALGDALDPRSAAVARTGAGLAWCVWAVLLLAVAVPRTIGLTAVRIAAPATLATALWAALELDDVGSAAIVAVSASALLVVAAFAPTTGDWCVNGSSYGDERRMPLRVPGALLFGPLALAWAAVVAPAVAGPLLLAARQWAAGAVVIVGGGAAAAVAARALHGLARRWVVFVPAGFVLHDHQAMVDPVLFPRASIARLGPAVVDGGLEPVDLTQGAFGLALQVDFTEPLEIARRSGGKAQPAEEVGRLRFTPTRPGALLAEARARRFEVG
jgi:hypothetical protein